METSVRVLCKLENLWQLPQFLQLPQLPQLLTACTIVDAWTDAYGFSEHPPDPT
jgi:hypothetical protein